jgi:hypothetical protein
VIPLIDVETLASWVVTLVVKVVAIVRVAGEAVVTCCDTRFAKKRSWGLFFLFFFLIRLLFWGFGILWKTFTTRAVEFIWFDASVAVGSCRVG